MGDPSDSAAPRQLSYLFRHLLLGGPVVENVEVVREGTGTKITAASEGIQARLQGNLRTWGDAVFAELVEQWRPEYGAHPVVAFRSSTSFRILGLCDRDDPDYVVKVPYRGR